MLSLQRDVVELVRGTLVEKSTLQSLRNVVVELELLLVRLQVLLVRADKLQRRINRLELAPRYHLPLPPFCPFLVVVAARKNSRECPQDHLRMIIPPPWV